MIRFSAGLVVAGLGLLLAGALTSELPLVYAAIGVSVIAAIMLAIGVIAGRDEIFGRDLPAAGDGRSTESAGTGRASVRGAVPESVAAVAPADDRIPAGKTAAGRSSGQESAVARASGRESAVPGSVSSARDTLSAGPAPLAATGPAATPGPAASFVPAPPAASPQAGPGETGPGSSGTTPSAGSPATSIDVGSSGLGWPAGKSPADELWARVDAELSAAGAAAQAPKLTKDSATQEVWERVELELTKPAAPWSPWEQPSSFAGSQPPPSSLLPPSSLAPPATRSPSAPPPFLPPIPAEQETARPWEPPAALSGPAQASPARASDPMLPALPRRPTSTDPSIPEQASSWADEWPAFKEAPGWTIDRAGRYAEPDEEPQAPADTPAADGRTAGSGETASTPEPAAGNGVDLADEPAEPGVTPSGWSREPAETAEPTAADEPAGVSPAEAESGLSVRDGASEPAGGSGFDWSRPSATAAEPEADDAGQGAAESGKSAGGSGFPGFDWSRPSGTAAEPEAGNQPETGKPAAAATDDRTDAPEQDSGPANATGSFSAFGWSRGLDAAEPTAGSTPLPGRQDRTGEPGRAAGSAGGSEPVKEAEPPRTGAFSAFGWSREPSASRDPGAVAEPAAGGGRDQLTDVSLDPAGSADAPGRLPGSSPGEPGASSSVSAFGWVREPKSTDNGPSAGARPEGGTGGAGWTPPSLGSRTTAGDPGAPRDWSAADDGSVATGGVTALGEGKAADDSAPSRSGIAGVLPGGRSAPGSGTQTSGWPPSPADQAEASPGGGADLRLPRKGTAANAELQFGLGRRPSSGDWTVPGDDTAPRRGTAARDTAAAEDPVPDTGEPKPDETVSARYQLQFGLGRRTAPGREPAAAAGIRPPAETYLPAEPVPAAEPAPDDSSAPDAGRPAAGGWGLPGSGGAVSETVPGTSGTTAAGTSAADMAGATERAPAFGGAVTPDKPDPASAPRWGSVSGTASGLAAGMVAKPGHVIVVQGVPRYHRSGCILIRFLGQSDLEQLTREAAEAAGCVPCRACQPDKLE